MNEFKIGDKHEQAIILTKESDQDFTIALWSDDREREKLDIHIDDLNAMGAWINHQRKIYVNKLWRPCES